MDTPIAEFDPLHSYTVIKGFDMFLRGMIFVWLWELIVPFLTPYIQTAIAYVIVWALSAHLRGF